MSDSMNQVVEKTETEVVAVAEAEAEAVVEAEAVAVAEAEAEAVVEAEAVAATEVQTATATVGEWVHEFLEEKFFNKCRVHYLLKNEVNRYCVTCGSAICKKCISTGFHEEHSVLTVYRHVYQDVVPLDQMKSHFDCSRIQHYRCNQKWVVSLTPLPHTGSGSLIKGNGACNVCKRKLNDPEQFSFCSMACKVESLSGRPVARKAAGEGSSGTPVGVGFRKRSRKGIPRRAAFW